MSPQSPPAASANTSGVSSTQHYLQRNPAASSFVGSPTHPSPPYPPHPFQRYMDLTPIDTLSTSPTLSPTLTPVPPPPHTLSSPQNSNQEDSYVAESAGGKNS
jgi:hypothetical protein